MLEQFKQLQSTLPLTRHTNFGGKITKVYNASSPITTF